VASVGSRDHVARRAAIVGAVLIAAAPARAQEPTATTRSAEGEALVVRWSAPAECPDEAALVQRITALVPDATGEGVAVEVDLRRESTRLLGSLALRTPWGSTTRELEAERCEAVLEATALLVAIAIEPLQTEQALAREQTVPIAPAPAPVVPASPPPPRPRASAPLAPAAPPSEPAYAEPSAAPPARTTQGTLRIEGGLAAGLLPEPGTTLAIAAGVRRGYVRVGAHAMLWPAQRALHPRDRTVSATLRPWAAGVHGCGGPRWKTLELPVCLAVDAGAMQGEGRGALVRADAAVRPYLALRLGPAIAWSPVPALALWLGADLSTTLLRPGFDIEALGPIHTAGWVSGRVFFAVEARFPARSARSAQKHERSPR
jgi:hypothetical protein